MVQNDPYYKARITDLKEIKPEKNDQEFSALVSSVKDLALRIIDESPNIPAEAAIAIKNIKKWTKADKRSSNFPMGLLGAKSYVSYEPLGTVGMISPWNFPVNLAFGPLAAIFAAGNQVMHKPSELTPLTASLMKDLCDKAFDETEFATFLGGPEVGAAFTKLHFDHLLYTGSGCLLYTSPSPRDS